MVLAGSCHLLLTTVDFGVELLTFTRLKSSCGIVGLVTFLVLRRSAHVPLYAGIDLGCTSVIKITFYPLSNYNLPVYYVDSQSALVSDGERHCRVDAKVAAA